MTDQATFPFGKPSTPRPPRIPSGKAELFVLGVYPSALHVRWSPPAWAQSRLGIGTIGALAVDDEPTVFWDGADARDRIKQWRADVQFREGDAEGDWGHVRAAGNGTSGRSVVERVLEPLGTGAEATWFSDVVDRFFVKSGNTRRREQADATTADYAPFAVEAGLPEARLPSRPGTEELIELGLAGHSERLREELTQARAPVVATLGEEARRVLQGIADSAGGPPALPLEGQRMTGDAGATYGEAGTVTLGDMEAQCYALVHPGQRSPTWTGLHDAWMRRRHG
ncbi:MAG: hypothetical protein HYX34_03945 [Actinobacteria bacterium]|nr:hypothetical protein [Actinomycetota bacterium]